MITHRKRPNARSQTERDLRAGKTTRFTEPDRLAIADAIRHRENHNPFRTETREHMIYNDMYKHTEEELQQCALQTLAETVPGIQRGLRTSSEFHSHC